MVGHLIVNAAALIAIRDALVMRDVDQAYHVLLHMADPEYRVQLRKGDHWVEWEAVAEHSPPFTA